MATASKPVSFDVKGFLNTLTCPFGHDPLIEAVTLFRCCHKVNRAAAVKMYGPIVDGRCTLKGKCLICNGEVTFYAPDHTIRDLVARLFGHEKEIEDLPKHPLVLAEALAEVKSEAIPPPYPGVPAVFKHINGDWNHIFDRGTPLRREMLFRSTTPGSFVSGFDLLGFHDGQVALCIYYERDEVFLKYLKTQGFDGKLYFYQTKSLSELQTLFRILSIHNKIADEYLPLIQGIIDRCPPDPLPLSGHVGIIW